MKSLRTIKQTAVSVLCVMAAFTGHAQYYYNDIVANKEVLREMQDLKEQKLHTINVMSLEGGVPTEGFFCQKKINKSYTEAELNTSTNTSYPNYFRSFFSKEGLLMQTRDSSEVSVTVTDHIYNDKQQLIKITSATDLVSDDLSDKGAEEHIYQYDDEGILKGMFLVKNATDTSIIAFMPDDAHNISIEKNTRTGDIYYYYYDTKKRLTDVVHTYNTARSKLIPDYKFEYNAEGRVTQMIASEKDGAYYFTWKYSYDNGLRTMERCYDKEGKLTGSIEYVYK